MFGVWVPAEGNQVGAEHLTGFWKQCLLMLILSVTPVAWGDSGKGIDLGAESQNMFSEASLSSGTSLVTQGSKSLLKAAEYKPTPDNLVTSLASEVKIQVQDQAATVAGAQPSGSYTAVVLSVPGQGLCLPEAGPQRVSGPRSILVLAELPLTQGPLQWGHLAAPPFWPSLPSLHKSERNGSKTGDGEKQEGRVP